MTTTDNQSTGNRSSWIYLLFLTLCLLAIGILFSRWIAGSIDRDLRDSLLQQTRMAANALDINKVKALSGTQADLDSPEYLQLKERLAAVNSANPKSRFVYLMGRRADGAVFFFLDSEPAGSEDESVAGDIYAEASTDIIRAFDTQTEVVEGPIRDRWGEWISVLVPLSDPGSGNMVALLGIDIDAKSWKWEIAVQAALPIALSLMLLGLLVLIIILARSRSRIVSYQQALGESEEKYRSIFHNAPLGLLHFNREGIITSCNDRFVEIIGSKREKFMGLNILSLPDKHFVEAVKLALQGKLGHYDDEYQSVTSNKIIPMRALFAPINSDSDQGEVIGGVGIIEDITERKKIEKQLKFLSFHDQLTGLYNRAFFDTEMQRLSRGREFPVTIISADVDELKFINDSMGHAQGDELLQAAARVLQKSLRGSDILARMGGDEFAVILPGTDQETGLGVLERVTANISLHNSKHPELPLSISMGVVTAENSEMSLEQTYKMADDLMFRQKLARRPHIHDKTIESLLLALEEMDYLSQGHGRRIAANCLAMGKKLGLSRGRLESLELLAGVHDLGHVTVPRQVLFKPGPLSEDEWEIIRGHPEKGRNIALTSPDFSGVADLILKHHERWDGSGYPLGLKGEDIPLECRILAIVDAYDAMTAYRPFKKAVSRNEALEELKRCAGTRFDPDLVKIFISVVGCGG